MLNTELQEILYDSDGAAWGVKCKDPEGNVGVAKATMLVGDPSYFPKEKVKVTGRVVRR